MHIKQINQQYQNEIQTAFSWSWTLLVNSFSYNDNQYTKCALMKRLTIKNDCEDTFLYDL